eukprot:48605-Hanusia_phi.AAC.1
MIRADLSTVTVRGYRWPRGPPARRDRPGRRPGPGLRAVTRTQCTVPSVLYSGWLLYLLNTVTYCHCVIRGSGGHPGGRSAGPGPGGRPRPPLLTARAA